MSEIYVIIIYIYDSQIVHHNPCFNLFILLNNSFNQGSEINKKRHFLCLNILFRTINFLYILFLIPLLVTMNRKIKKPLVKSNFRWSQENNKYNQFANILYVKVNLIYWFKCCQCTVSSAVFPVQSNNTQQYIIVSFNKEFKDYKHLLFVQELLIINIQNLDSRKHRGEIYRRHIC